MLFKFSISTLAHKKCKIKNKKNCKFYFCIGCEILLSDRIQQKADYICRYYTDNGDSWRSTFRIMKVIGLSRLQWAMGSLNKAHTTVQTIQQYHSTPLELTEARKAHAVHPVAYSTNRSFKNSKRVLGFSLEKHFSRLRGQKNGESEVLFGHKHWWRA